MKLQLLTPALVLAASLVTASAAAPLKGTYTGLFFEREGYWEQSSGLLTLKVTPQGRYSGTVQAGPYRHSFSGAFDQEGFTARAVLRRFAPALLLELQVDAEDSDVIFGTISDGTWTADVVLDRDVFSGSGGTSFDAGQYTMIIPGDFTDPSIPGGDGYGTLTVNNAGRLRFAGSLADGTKVSQSTVVAKGGQWPFYISLYRGYGALYGWMLLNQSEDEPLAGDLTWIRGEMPWSWYFPDGFGITVGAWGSRYYRPGKGEKILDLTHATMEFNGGNLHEGVTNRVILEYNNRLTNLENNPLKVSFSPGNGTFSGKFVDPVTWQWLSFRGVVLQDYAVAAGYFLDWSQSGEVWLQPQE
jgi:hypothetical protein